MGKLIVFEGIDGSGKSTQVRLLRDWLINLGYDVVLTKWFSGKYANYIIDKLNNTGFTNHTTGAHIVATDFAWRLESIIIPALKANKIVICDRYVYTPLTREVLRGINEEYIRQVYSFALKEDIVFYFDVDAETAYRRKMETKDITFFESALDLYSNNSIYDGLKRFIKGEYPKEMIRECFVKYQSELNVKYKLLPEYPEFNVISSYNDCEENFTVIKEKCLGLFKERKTLHKVAY